MWKKIDRNSNYSINEQGQVRNDTTNLIKKPFINKKNGYLIIDLYKNNKSQKVPIHRLLAEAFIDNPKNKPTVDHIDGNRKNNAISNLRWATYSENNSRFNTNGVRSEQVIVTKYAEETKKRGGGHLRWLNIVEVKEFEKISDVAIEFDCNISNISAMLKKGEIGRRGKMRGYLFTYKNSKRSKY